MTGWGTDQHKGGIEKGSGNVGGFVGVGVEGVRVPDRVRSTVLGSGRHCHQEWMETEQGG